EKLPQRFPEMRIGPIQELSNLLCVQTIVPHQAMMTDCRLSNGCFPAGCDSHCHFFSKSCHTACIKPSRSGSYGNDPHCHSSKSQQSCRHSSQGNDSKSQCAKTEYSNA